MVCSNPKYYSLICCVICFFILLTYLIINSGKLDEILENCHTASNNVVDSSTENFVFDSFHGERVVHLDLKGAPPSIEYFENIFPLFYDLGVTSLLIEYEDMFPYPSKYTKAINAFTRSDIEKILDLAKANKLNVIPLVQTFGHLEFLLKLKKFAQFREVHNYTESICPSHNLTLSIITGLLDEIIEAHPNIQYIHIGGDEVFQLGVCQKCNKKMASNNWNADDLFLDHISRVAKYVRSKVPHVVPLMWDDQLRSISLHKMKKYDIGSLVVPVIWSYRKTVSFPLSMWEKYGNIFPSVWIASCFKGASSSDQILTNIGERVENQKSWMRVIAENDNIVHFEGVVMTGWQRFDHFGVLCELLPVGIPSLVHVAMVLDGINSVRYNESDKIRSVLACGVKNEKSTFCVFPGVEIYFAVVKFSKLKSEIDQVLTDNLVKEFFNDYNLRMKYFSTFALDIISHKILDCQSSLKSVEMLLYNALSAVYDKYTVNEWIGSNIKPYNSRLNCTLNTLRELSGITYWEPRYADSAKNSSN